VNQQCPRRCNAFAPVPDVGTCWAVAVGAIDVQHCNFASDIRVRLVAVGAHMAHTIGDTSSRQVREERLVVGRCCRGVALDLPRSAVGASVRLDRDHLHSRWCCGCENNRAAPAETADLDNRVARRSACCRGGEQSPLALGQPTCDIRRARPDLIERCVGRTIHPTYTPKPNSTIQTNPIACNQRSAAKISSGAAPWPCSSTSV